MSRIQLILVLLLAGTSAFAQNYPLPASGSEPAAVCTGCPGTNASGQSNNGLPTYPYNAPLDFAGRFLDSSSTGNVQNAGMRTVRARTVRTVPSRNRLYMQLGEAVFVYSLDTFFTTRLAEPMIPLNTLNFSTIHGWGGRNGVYEKVLWPDALFYPECRDSEWVTVPVDAQRALHEYDLDDRGYLYAATVFMGWGIQHDDGRTNGSHLPFVHQDDDSPYYFYRLFVIRNGSSYFMVGSEQYPARLRILDVTNPAAPVLTGTRSGWFVSAFAKDELTQRLAIADNTGKLRVYSYAGFVANEAPLVEYAASSGNTFTDVTFDDSGNVWATEAPSFGTSGQLWKLNGATLAKTTYDYSPAFAGAKLHASGGYVAVLGRSSDNRYGVRLFDVRGFNFSEIAIDDFFRNYYYRAPSGYAQQYMYAEAGGVYLVKQGTKTYLMMSAGGLGDVYEIPTYERSVTALSPATGPTAGGTAVTITGVNLEGTPSVTFGGVNAASITVTNGRIIAVTPPGPAGPVNVVVTYTGSAPLVVPQQFTYALPAAPQNFTATGSGVSVSLTWSAVDGASTYELSRYLGNGTWGVLSSQAGIGYTDSNVSSAQTYLYRLRAMHGTDSSPYAMDVATTMPLATTTITPGSLILASHIADVQNGVNALRAAAGLAAVSFPAVNAGESVLATHVTAPRAALEEARTALGLTTSFTDVPPSVIRAIHVQELLDAVR